MKQKKWATGVAAGLLLLFLLTGYMAIAAELGSKTDPLVTFSYISEELKPTITKLINETIAEKTKEFQNTLDSEVGKYKREIDEKISSFESSFSGDLKDQGFIDAVADAVLDQIAQGQAPSDTGSEAIFKKIEIAAGKTFSGKNGCEVILRLGNANCVASSDPGLIDVTTGGTLGNGKALEKNHLYFISIDGRGFKAKDKVTVFVRGEYTLS